MKIRGVCYDVGTVYGAGPFSIRTRPVFDAAVTNPEMEIIGRDLHCNAVRIRGRDIARLMTAAQVALNQGLDVLLSPEWFDRSQQETASPRPLPAAANVTLSRAGPGCAPRGIRVNLAIRPDS